MMTDITNKQTFLLLQKILEPTPDAADKYLGVEILLLRGENR